MVCPRAYMAKDFTEYVRVAKSKSTTVALPQPVARRGKSPDTVARSTRTHSFGSNTRGPASSTASLATVRRCRRSARALASRPCPRSLHEERPAGHLRRHRGRRCCHNRYRGGGHGGGHGNGGDFRGGGFALKHQHRFDVQALLRLIEQQARKSAIAQGYPIAHGDFEKIMVRDTRYKNK